MNDEFLIRVDEELPSDHRTAVKLVETRILSDEYRSKLETVIEKLENISAINNVGILEEMRDILSGLLESISVINNKYIFLSEMIIKLDEKNPEMGERIDRLAAGLADLFADTQTSLSSLSTKLGDLQDIAGQKDPLLADSVIKIEEKMNEISVINAELAEKLENASADTSEMFGRLEENLSGMSVSAVSINESVERISQSNSDLLDKIGEMSVSNAELHERQLETSEKINDVGAKLDNLYTDNSKLAGTLNEMRVSNLQLLGMTENMDNLSSRLENKIAESSAIMAGINERVSGLESNYGAASGAILKLDEKMADLSGLKEAVSSIEEKLNNVSIANSELLGNIHDSIRNAENRYDTLYDILQKFDEKVKNIMSDDSEAFSRISDKISGIEDKLRGIGDSIESMDKPSVEIDTSYMTRGIQAVNEKVDNTFSTVGMLNDKINDALIQNRELSDKLDQIPENGIPELRSEINSMGKKISGMIESMESGMFEKIDNRIQLASEESHRLRREMEELESRLKKQSDEILSAIAQLKAKPVKRGKKASKKRRVRRARRRARVRITVDNETLDTLIVNTLNTASMNIPQLRDTTRIGEKKLRERLDILMARGVVVREKRGRSIFYVSRAEQTMPTG